MVEEVIFSASAEEMRGSNKERFETFEAKPSNDCEWRPWIYVHVHEAEVSWEGWLLL